MLGQEFRAKSSRRDLEWRDRTVLRQGCRKFGPDGDGFEVFVTAETAAAMTDATQRASPRESFGVLLGQHYRDNKGPYTVVCGVLYSHLADAGAAHVRVSAEDMSRLKKDAIRKYPASSLMGWTHSHHSPGGYSPTDFDEQSTWPSDYHVGILTFMTGTPWAAAYRGRSGMPLVAEEDEIDDVIPSDMPARGATGIFGHRPRVPAAIHELGTFTPSSSNMGDDVKRASCPWLQPVSVAAGLVLFTLMWALLFVHFNSEFEGVRGDVQDVGDQLRSIARTQPAIIQLDEVDWNCEPLSGPAPLTVTCSAPVQDGVTGWIWDLGRGRSADTPTASQTYAKPGRYAIQLTVLTPLGSIDGGTAEIFVHNGVPNLREGCLRGSC